MPRSQLTRRALLTGGLATVGAGVGITALLDGGDTSTTATGCATTTAWTLATSWTTPRGARGRLSCRCRACRSHAAAKVYASEADALAVGLRAHPGCLCVPTPVSISSAGFRAVFAGGVGVVDRRDDAVSRALGPCGPDTASTAAPGARTTTSAPGAPATRTAGVAPASAPQTPTDHAAGSPAVSTTDSATGTADTGAADPDAVAAPPGPGTQAPGRDAWTLTGLGAAVLTVVGLGLLHLRRRDRGEPAGLPQAGPADPSSTPGPAADPG